jgi:hypothetical protein
VRPLAGDPLELLVQVTIADADAEREAAARELLERRYLL